MSQNNRWTTEALIDPQDRSRVRAFIRNEMAYYNALVTSFGARLRTMPEIFEEVDEGLLAAVAADGFNLRSFDENSLPEKLSGFRGALFEEGKLKLGERELLFFDAVTVGATLHPDIRRAIASEILRVSRSQADALRQSPGKMDQVHRGPVELLTPHDGRVKRHVQLPAKATRLSEDRKRLAISYATKPLVLSQPAPDTRYNLVVVRDVEGPGRNERWEVEFRQEQAPYLVRLTDPPQNKRDNYRTVVGLDHKQKNAGRHH